MNRQAVTVGISDRSTFASWTRANLDRFDVLEIAMDHCIHGGVAQRAEIFDLVGRTPLDSHGTRVSIGTNAPPLKLQQGARQ